MDSRLTVKQLLIATILAGIFVILVLVFFVIRPQIGALVGLHDLVQQRHNEYNALVVEENSYRTARIDFAKIQANAEIITGLFPIKERLVGNIERLEAAAAAASDEFSLSIADPEQDESKSRAANTIAPTYAVVPNLRSVEVIPYDFTVAGSFVGVIHFLQILEHQPFYSEIETLALSSEFLGGLGPPEKQVRTGLVEGHMRAAFYAKQENP